ncbi:hypothetical protein ATCC90586_004066 [Pythium insidiosum]|nr:hypothetical protein ATCC90586_004066 [Pythium insidiosum]
MRATTTHSATTTTTPRSLAGRSLVTLSPSGRPLSAMNAKNVELSPPSDSAPLTDQHALLSAYEARPTRPKRSSSERSKEFRAKRKKYEEDLVVAVEQLRHEVTDLTMRRSVAHETKLHHQHHVAGSLTNLVREYFLIFQHGLAAPEDHAKAAYQRDFLQQHMRPDVALGDDRGIDAVVRQWQQLTVSHASLYVELGEVVRCGSHEDPVVTIRTKLHVRFSRETFAMVFPAALYDETLQALLLNRSITYDCLSSFQFSPDNRIRRCDLEMDVVDALLHATGSIAAVVKLTSEPAVSVSTTDADQSREAVANDIKREPHDNVDLVAGEVEMKVESIEPVDSVRQCDGSASPTPSVSPASPTSKLSMNFLLS